MDPDEALERARAARGEHEGDPALAPTDLDRLGSERVGFDQLREWAVIDVDPATLRSTRRMGAPVTAFKRLLLRLLRQYTADLEAQQTRFNLALLDELEQRLRALERDRGK
jgi:hypothetical protein